MCNFSISFKTIIARIWKLEYVTPLGVAHPSGDATGITGFLEKNAFSPFQIDIDLKLACMGLLYGACKCVKGQI